ncbi:MAG: 4Fe-4S dicluster domain-containing protein [Candidatus Schekmanbacteria bacterium]|nr:4Fe-4S dicluster domain-containing protein [Candidatus Schekmanbacteria bacterium]
MSQLGWTINLGKCVGCRACAMACNAELNTNKGARYRQVIEKQGGDESAPKRLFVTMSCFHCDEPACLKSCPVGAISKDDNFGIVLIDQDKCIGCKYCAKVCPYSAPQFNSETGKVEKCTFCVHRVLDSGRTSLTGLKPACANTCIGKALSFGEDVGNTGEAPVKFSDRKHTNPSVTFEWGSDDWNITPW